MKLRIFSFLLIPWIAYAQLEISAFSPRQNFLLYEPIELTIELRNISAKEMVLDNREKAGDPWLSFIVLKADGSKVESDNHFMPSACVLPPREQKRFSVNITPWYRIRETGHYRIQAAVRMNSENAFVTQPFSINIGSGNIVLESSRVVRGVQRQYNLLSFSDQQQLRLYLRVEEPSKNIVYATHLLGSYNPSLKISGPLFDAQNRLHLLHPKSSQQFCYTMTDEEGRVLTQKDVSLATQLLQKENGTVELQSFIRQNE
ncbi:MAG: hypothetical protein ACOY3I_02685 [Verrucomicrobiota bacterium]